MASGVSWLMTTSVRPRSVLVAASRSMAATAVSGASAEVLSSHGGTSGSAAKAQARATR